MSRLPLLECFDQVGLPSDAVPQGPGADWLQGHATGWAEAEAAALARQDTLSDALSQSLADLIFSHAQARRHVLGGLQPLFETLIAQVLPALAQTSFAPQLLMSLSAAAERDSGGTVVICLHPAQIAAVEACLAIQPKDQVSLRADPSLSPGQARIATPQGETALDTERVLLAATEVLATLFDHTDIRRHHG